MGNRFHRLLAMSEAARRQARQTLARALADRHSAVDHEGRVTALIAGTGCAPGRAIASGLSAAAGLRALLEPARQTAAQRADVFADTVRQAEAALKTAEARHARLEEMQAEARRRLSRKTELKMADDRPQPIRTIA